MIKKLSQLFKNLHIFAIPALSVLLSIFISILPYQITDFSLLMPLFTPMVIYFWSIYQPQSLSYVVVFFLGLLKDILENNVLGVSALCFLLFQAMIRSQRLYIINNAFIVVWAGFIFFLSIILLMPLALVYLSADIQPYKFSIIFSQWLITVFVYVPVHWLLSKLNNLNNLN